VISLPALRAIRAGFPTSRLAVLVKAELAGFFDGLNWIDEAIPYRAASRISAWMPPWAIIRELRAREFDLAVLFPNSFASALWMTLAGIPRRVGYVTDARGIMLTHRARPAPDALSGHQAAYWSGMVRDALDVTLPEHAFEHPLEVNGAHLARMRAWLDEHRATPRAPLIAIAPIAAYGPAKEWPGVRYAALIDWLAEQFGAECVIVGTAAERERCEVIAVTAQARPIVAAGAIGLGELIALLSLCGGFAGNDSGAMHLAAAVGTPTVGIFGSTDPARTGPLGPNARIIHHPPPCSPCLARTCRFGHYDCLRAIEPNEVAGTLARLGAFGPR
jgi:heptosyltransferase-2